MKPIVKIVGVGLLALALRAALKKKNQTATEDNFDSTVITVSTKPIVASLNQNLVLQRGSKGEEVKKLQTLLGVTADGFFGPITETKLIKLKGVTKISISQFLATPTINQNILKVGTNVMAKLKTGTPIYNAIPKADASYYSDYKTVKKVDYGREVGQIRSVNPAGNWYAVYYPTMIGKKVGFVRATDVEKY